MKIITRYVLSEMLQVFLVALTALTLFMLVIGLTKEAQQQGLGLLQIIALVPYVLPDAMRFAVPGTMLFAVASVFGRFSSSNEITALKAAGITPEWNTREVSCFPVLRRRWRSRLLAFAKRPRITVSCFRRGSME